MSEMSRAKSRLPGRSVSIVVKDGVSAESLHSVLDRILELSGCPMCGFQGIDDFTIRVVNPEISRVISKIEGIEAISVGGLGH